MGKTTKRVLDSDRFKSRDLGFTGAKTELDSDGNNRPFTLPRLEVFLNADALPGPEKRALMVRGYLGYEQAKGSSTFAWNVCAGVFLAMLLPMPVVSGIRQCTDHMDDCYNQKYKQKLVRESEREDIEINSPNAERMSHSRFLLCIEPISTAEGVCSTDISMRRPKEGHQQMLNATYAKYLSHCSSRLVRSCRNPVIQTVSQALETSTLHPFSFNHLDLKSCAHNLQRLNRRPQALKPLPQAQRSKQLPVVTAQAACLCATGIRVWHLR